MLPLVHLTAVFANLSMISASSQRSDGFPVSTASLSKTPGRQTPVVGGGSAVRGRWKRRTRLLGAVEGAKAAGRSPCHPNYCRNGGSCQVNTRQRSGFLCACKPQFSGLRCDNGPYSEDADCLKIPCRGRGRCVHTTSGFLCQCEAGFTGDTCEDSDGTRDRDYSVAVIIVISIVLVLFILTGLFLTAVENERQNRTDKYYYYIRLRMKPPEPTGFLPVASSVAKYYCAKICRRGSSKKKPGTTSSKGTAAALPQTLPQSPVPPYVPGAVGGFPLPRHPGVRMPPQGRFPVPAMAPLRDGVRPPWPRQPPPTPPRFPRPMRPPVRFPRPPMMPPRHRPPVK